VFKKYRRWVLEALVIGIVFFCIMQWQQKDLLSKSMQAPQFNLSELQGEQTLPIYTPGRRTLVYFFAPWCSICKLSMGNLNNLNADMSMVAVALSYENEAAVSAFIEDQEIRVPVLLGNPQVATAFQVSVFPTYYILDAEGKVEAHSVGYSSEIGMQLRTLW